MIKEAMQFIADLQRAADRGAIQGSNVPWRNWVTRPDRTMELVEDKAVVSHEAESL